MTSNDTASSSSQFMGAFHHIISAGKDGKVLVQDVRNAYFPGDHMSSNVTAISALGHVAFHRSKISRVSIELYHCQTVFSH
jgi:hypothetical protein